ncbi:head GIN domain-containing protein [Lacinutrix himadriensis]|uniref:head GIN domain-containing protein n=1 Tax=Lacinutrix himadriensis TaxID=641549 RepID=UPI0006E39707|nr:head GIN domain-containing protein [Lacinutrix himadriensis]
MKNAQSFQKTILIIATILLTTQIQAQSWFGNKVKGNGKVTTISRTTGDYDAIACVGSMDFILVEGQEGKITIEGEENLLEHIITEVKNNTLIVKVENGVDIRESHNKTIKITIPFKDIDKVSLTGSGDVWNTDTITETNLEVSLTGSGDIVLDIKTNNVAGSVTGSGDVTLKGKTINLEASVTGSGDFNGNNLQAENTEVSVRGSGDADVYSTETLRARVSGSGDIEYSGNPKKENTKVAGSGSIRSN